MNWFSQLLILLWKNLTLKRRRPIVCLFEIVIPLVIFFTLIGIRKKEPLKKHNEAFFHAMPLPSSGVINVMQAFCDNGVRDEHGFLQYTNSTVRDFLHHLNSIAKDNRLFSSELTPEDMDQIPVVYKRMIEDPVSIQKNFEQTRDIPLEEIIHSDRLWSFLHHNTSLSSPYVEMLKKSRINTTALYHSLFGKESIDRDASDGSSITSGDSVSYDYDDSNNLRVDSSREERIIDGRRRRSIFEKAKQIAHNVLHKRVNKLPSNLRKPVHQLLKSQDRSAEEETLYSDSGGGEGKGVEDSWTHKHTDGFLYRFLHKLLLNSTLISDQDSPVGQLVKKWTENMITAVAAANNTSSSFDPSFDIDPRLLAETIKIVVTSPEALINFGCGGDRTVAVDSSSSSAQYPTNDRTQYKPLPIIIWPKMKDDKAYNISADGQNELCNLSRSEMGELSEHLRQSISAEDIIGYLNLTQWNLSDSYLKAQQFVNDLELYTMINKGLFRLSKLATSLPLESCPSLSPNITTPSPLFSANTTEEGSPALPASSPSSPASGGGRLKSDSANNHENIYRLWVAMRGMLCGEKRKKPAAAAEEEQSVTSADMTANMSTTLSPGDGAGAGGVNSNGASGGQTQTGASSSRKDNKKKSKSNKKSSSDERLPLADDLLPSSEKSHLSVLLHLLYSNPKVLFAPNNTDSVAIIQKANRTFELMAQVSEYARKWLNISKDLRNYLQKNTTETNIESLTEIQRDLKNGDDYFSLFNMQQFDEFAFNVTIFPAQSMIEQLETIDMAACSWLSMSEGLNLNIFRGFQTEDEIVNYALYRAYKDNVTVFASLVFEMGINGSLPSHLVYKIRQNASLVETTNLVRNKYWWPGPRNWGYQYYNYGFLWIQDIIERAFIDLQVGRDVVEPGSYLQQMPYPCYIYDRFFYLFKHLLALCLVIAWVYPVAMLTQNIVLEKELGLKEVCYHLISGARPALNQSQVKVVRFMYCFYT